MATTSTAPMRRPFYLRPPWNILFEISKLEKLTPWNVNIAYLLRSFLTGDGEVCTRQGRFPRFRRRLGFFRINLPYEVKASAYIAGAATSPAEGANRLCSTTPIPAATPRINIHNHPAPARSPRRCTKRRKTACPKPRD